MVYGLAVTVLPLVYLKINCWNLYTEQNLFCIRLLCFVNFVDKKSGNFLSCGPERL